MTHSVLVEVIACTCTMQIIHEGINFLNSQKMARQLCYFAWVVKNSLHSVKTYFLQRLLLTDFYFECKNNYSYCIMKKAYPVHKQAYCKHEFHQKLNHLIRGLMDFVCKVDRKGNPI